MTAVKNLRLEFKDRESKGTAGEEGLVPNLESLVRFCLWQRRFQKL